MLRIKETKSVAEANKLIQCGWRIRQVEQRGEEIIFHLIRDK